LKAVGEDGVRLNIRKATLREWRRDFAAALRMQDVAANATERAVRGVSRTSSTDGIYRAMRRGDSRHLEDRATAVARDLAAGHVHAEAGKESLVRTRKAVETGWLRASELLDRQGDAWLASEVRQFVNRMPPPRTDREWLAAELREHLVASRSRGVQPPTR
jgi:hypothetical protein